MDWVPALFLCLLSVKFRSERNPYQEAQTVVFVAWLFVVTFRKPVVKRLHRVRYNIYNCLILGLFPAETDAGKENSPYQILAGKKFCCCK